MDKNFCIEIPGLGELKVKYLVLDLNGTLRLTLTEPRKRLLKGFRCRYIN